MSAEIYIILAETAYEPTGIVCAYSDRETADQFSEKCNRHHNSQPPMPLPEEKSEEAYNDAWAIYQCAFDRWHHQHPAKDHYSSDSFRVLPVKLNPK